MRLKSGAFGAMMMLGCTTSAMALDPWDFGPFSLELSGKLEGKTLQSQDTDEDESKVEGKAGFDLLFAQPIGSLTFGAMLAAELEFDTLDDPKFEMDDPELSIWLEGDKFGRLSFNDDSSAIDELCVEAPKTGETFDNEEFAEVSTCPAFDDRSVLYYQSPELGAWTIGVSYMPDDFLPVKDGDAAESYSFAVAYKAEDASGAEWEASIAFEQVLKLKNESERPLGAQAGLSWKQDGWKIGGAVGLTDLDDGTQERGLGLGIVRNVTEKLEVGAGANWSQIKDAGNPFRQISLSAVAQYTIIPDRLTADAGLWNTKTTESGVKSSDTVLGVGIGFKF